MAEQLAVELMASGSQERTPGRRRGLQQADRGVPPELTEVVRTRVEEVLRHKGLRKGELARALGMRPNHLWGLLTGKVTLSLTWINRMAAVLGVPPAYLLSEDNPTVVLALTRRPVYRHLAAELTRLSDDDLMRVLRFVIDAEGGSDAAEELAAEGVVLHGQPKADRD